DPRLHLRPDPAHLAQPSLGGRGAQLVRRPDPELSPDLDGSARADAEQPAERGELQRDVLLELAQLGDLAGLDELAEPRLDPGPDPAQLADASGAHELGDRSRCRPDEVGRLAVRALAVVARARQLEERA